MVSFGGVQLQPFPNRQYSRAARGRKTLTAEIREVDPRWINVLRTAPERRTLVQGPRPVVIYVDAAACGHLWTIVFIDGGELTFSTHTPEWISPADIYDFEMAASLFGASLASVVFPGRPGIFRCDNRAATQTLVRGYRKTVTGRAMCAGFWTIAATFSAPVWIESSVGTLNPSDKPSTDSPLRSKPFNAPHKCCGIHNI